MSFSLVNFEQKIMVFPSRSVSADVPYLSGYQNDTSEILKFVHKFLQSSSVPGLGKTTITVRCIAAATATFYFAKSR